ncbi:MAG: GLUG motif-containing protein [Planctomycetota bacterium]|jgi:hypothetical protein
MTMLRNPRILRTIPLLMVLFLVGMPAYAQYGGGTGEPDNPYLIYTAEQLNTIGTRQDDWGKHFRLMADIDMSSFTGTDFNIIGYWIDRNSPDNKPFTGVFDGNDHAISNLSCASPGRVCVGLFGHVDGYSAEIRNLRLVDPNIDAPDERYVGSLVGFMGNATITGCGMEGGSVRGNDIVGGLVGYNGGHIATSYSTGTVSGDRRIGGLMGRNWGNISTSYSTGEVTANSDAGGLVSGNYGSITTSYSTAAVTANSDVGGLASGNYSSVTTSYSTGTVSGSGRVGGLVAYNWEGATVTSSFWDVETSGQSSDEGATGKPTAQMKQKITFADWDFLEVWDIVENQTYPFIRPQPVGDLNDDDRVNMLDLALLAEHWLEGTE